jgi:hypothetical protein
VIGLCNGNFMIKIHKSTSKWKLLLAILRLAIAVCRFGQTIWDSQRDRLRNCHRIYMGPRNLLFSNDLCFIHIPFPKTPKWILNLIWSYVHRVVCRSCFPFDLFFFILWIIKKVVSCTGTIPVNLLPHQFCPIDFLDFSAAFETLILYQKVCKE